jgi:hypothetical protein
VFQVANACLSHRFISSLRPSQAKSPRLFTRLPRLTVSKAN